MKVEVKVFDNHNPAHIKSDLYLKTYRAWHETWQEEYSRLDPESRLPSDTFTRQDSFISVFIDGECAGLNLFHFVDVSTEFGRADSYFEPWPEDVVQWLAQREPYLLVANAYTVSKSFRGFKIGDIALKDFLAASIVQYQLQSPFKFMLGNMRNTRGANTVMYNIGAELLRTVICHNEPSDLVVFKRDELPPFPSKMQSLIDEAWANPDPIKQDTLKRVA